MKKYQIIDNKKYFFNSKKFSSLNSFYGINEEIRKTVDESQKKQETYLKNHFVNINDKSFVSFSLLCSKLTQLSFHEKRSDLIPI